MMMRATLAVALVWAFVTLVAGLVMQAELFVPGLQVYFSGGEPATELHMEFWAIHGVVAVFALPLTVLGAVGCLHLASFAPASSRYSIGWQVAAGVLLLHGGLIIASAFVLEERESAIDISLPRGLAVALSIILASLACFRDQPSRRAAAPWLVFALFLAAMAGFMRLVLDNAGIDHVLHDTQYTVAAWHAGGGALALVMLGLLSAVARRAGKDMLGWLSGVIAGLITLAWAGMVVSQAQLGRMGMPRLYADYPEAFSVLQARAGLCAGLAVFLVLVALVRLGVARVRLPAEGPASAF